MKRVIAYAMFLVSAAVIPAIPAISAKSENSPPKAETLSQEEKASELTETAESAENTAVSYEPYRVLNCSTGEIQEVSVRDYVIGAVAAEMPASFAEEALKAQAVAAHTYAERQRNMQKKYPDKALGNADFSDDPNKYQGFYTDEKIRYYFGDNYDLHYNKIAKAVDEVLPYIMMYEDEPIIAAFHSMSSGKTESAENMWGTAVDYLVPVNSKSDKDAPDYADECEISAEFVRARLEKVIEGIQLGDNPENWIKTGEKSPSGTVLEVTVGDKKVTGNDIRQAFGLRSADFSVEFDGENFIFRTCGYGHGVGMSQYGANYMAEKGSKWREILEHYYCDVEIDKVDFSG